VKEESAGQGKRGRSLGSLILGPGEGRKIPGTDAMTLKATGKQTGGSIGSWRRRAPWVRATLPCPP